MVFVNFESFRYIVPEWSLGLVFLTCSAWRSAPGSRYEPNTSGLTVRSENLQGDQHCLGGSHDCSHWYHTINIADTHDRGIARGGLNLQPQAQWCSISCEAAYLTPLNVLRLVLEHLAEIEVFKHNRHKIPVGLSRDVSKGQLYLARSPPSLCLESVAQMILLLSAHGNKDQCDEI